MKTRLLLVVLLLAPGAFAQNLLVNGAFDSSLSSWVQDPNGSTDSTWSGWDADGSPSSGSLLMNFCDLPDSICTLVVQPPMNRRSQCVNVAPGTGTFRGSADFYRPSTNSGSAIAGVSWVLFEGANCTGTELDRREFSDSEEPVVDDQWFRAGPYTLGGGLSTVRSARVELTVFKPGGGASASHAAHFDNVVLQSTGPAPAISIDGITSGRVDRLLTYSAKGSNCSGPLDTGWLWSAPGATIRGLSSSSSLSVAWPAPGTYIVSVTHPSCVGASASTQVEISRQNANVVIERLPEALVQEQGGEAASTSYVLRNTGDLPATIVMTRSGTFFEQSPSTFDLEARAARTVTITALDVPPGSYSGTSTPTGQGVGVDIRAPIRLLVVGQPATDPIAVAQSNRIDLASTDPVVSGTASFRNVGTGTVRGVLSSSVAWLTPEDGEIVIEPGATREVSFTIDRSKRPDRSAPGGSVSGDLRLTYRAALRTKGSGDGASPNAGSTATLATPVTIVDTVPPLAQKSAIPPLGEGEVALFVPGVGHVRGSVGLFISDLIVTNLTRGLPSGQIALYFTPLSSAPQTDTKLAAVSSVAPQQPLAMADLVSSVFGSQASVGSLQVRSSDIESLRVIANVFNSDNPRGTFGTVIPTFRSDRGTAPGGQVYLTGLTEDETSHTNLYLAEVSGSPVTIRTEFLNAGGGVVSTREDDLPGFGVVQRGFVVPAGAVSAVLTNTGVTGRFAAYATPVDDASGDTWAVSDWAAQYGYARSEPTVIPVAGAVRGANETFFRTDVAIFSTGSEALSGELRYIDRDAAPVSTQISLPPMQTLILEDVTGGLFGISGDTVGYLTFTPTTGEAAITSRNYTTVGGSAGTFGSGVPTLSRSGGLRAGELRRIGGIEDTTRETIEQGRPASFRTNFGLVETGGAEVVVRVTARYDLAGSLATQRASAFREYFLQPGQFLLVGNLLRAILGEERETLLGDARNVEVDFEVVDGSGTVEVFVSSVDNGTGDSLLRVE